MAAQQRRPGGRESDAPRRHPGVALAEQQPPPFHTPKFAKTREMVPKDLNADVAINVFN